MRALIYARVSHDPKGRGRSVAEQTSECDALCAREGWTVVDILTDNDRSASRHAKRERPAWGEAREAITSGTVDVLVTWEASRAQRDLAAYTELRQLCAAAGVKWAYSGTVYDLTDRSDRFRTGLDALVAEDEADRIRERVLRAMRANAQSGLPHGRRLYGYRRVYDSTGNLVGQEPEPDEAALVVDAAQRFLAGESLRSIADRYGWDPGNVRRLLRNPAYTGRRLHLGQATATDAWPAIIDGLTHARIVAKLADPERQKFRSGPRVHLLSGVAQCGVCDGPMTYSQTKPRGRPARPKYICRHNHCTGRDLAALDAYVTAAVLERLSLPDATMSSDADNEAAMAMAEVIDLRARIDDAYGAFAKGGLSATLMGRAEADIIPLIADAEKRARVVSLPTVAHDLAVADDPAAQWDSLAVEQRREIVRALLVVIVDRVAVRGRNGFDPSSVRIEWRR